MKILIVGLGSIGTRHIKNCDRILSKMGIVHRFDALRSLGRPLSSDISGLISNTFHDFIEVPNGYDIALITNPTALHYEAITHLLSKTYNMFIEKPIFENSGYDLTNLRFGSGVYYVACPIRYTQVFGALQGIFSQNHIFAVRAICSSYLPDWRPNMDYRHSYSAKRELGGGVAVDLIHEWDYLTELLGMPQSIECIHGKYSELEINSEDTALYLAQYIDKTLELHLDYYGRAERREVEFYTPDDVIIGDFIRKEVRWLKCGKVIPFIEDSNDCYLAEIEYFLKMCLGLEGVNRNSVDHALKILRLTEGTIQ